MCRNIIYIIFSFFILIFQNWERKKKSVFIVKCSQLCLNGWRVRFCRDCRWSGQGKVVFPYKCHKRLHVSLLCQYYCLQRSATSQSYWEERNSAKKIYAVFFVMGQHKMLFAPSAKGLLCRTYADKTAADHLQVIRMPHILRPIIPLHCQSKDKMTAHKY